VTVVMRSPLKVDVIDSRSTSEGFVKANLF
jgi:hypothetical protein